jgi:hypothetical protein
VSLDALIAALGAAMAEQTARARALRSRASSPPRWGTDDSTWIEALADDGVGLAAAVLRAEEIRAAIERHLGLDECDCDRHRDEAHERAARQGLN